MCITNNLQRHIRNLTNDGEVVARFFVDTVEGKHSDAKYHHKLEAAKLLNRYGSSFDDEPSQFWGLIPTPEELAASPSRHSGENGNPAGQGGGETENSQLNTQNSPLFVPYTAHRPPDTPVLFRCVSTPAHYSSHSTY